MEKIAGKFNLELMILLGSYNTADFIPGQSDIDLAFLSSQVLATDEYLILINELSKYFRYSKIDLIDLKKASGLLKYQVATKGRLLYEKEQGSFLRYSLYCLRYYYDTAKFRRWRQDYLKAQLEELANERT